MSTEPRNPYNFNSPVKDPKYFAGRAQELKEIEYYLDLSKSETPQFTHLALIGMRSSGKTSLLNMIAHLARQRGLLPVKISLNNEVVQNDVLFFKEVFDAILTEGKEREIFSGFYNAFRKIVDRLEAGLTIPLLFGDAYIGWKKGSGASIPQSVLIHDLKKLSEEVKTRQVSTIVLLFDECDLLSQNETLLQKMRNAFQEVDGYVLVFSGTEKMFPALSDVFSPIPRFFKRINVENFKTFEETKECILKPLTAEEAKQIDERIIPEIHFLTGGSPHEVNLVSHHVYKRWNKDSGQKMALSIEVLDDVLEQLERLRKMERHAIADKVKSYWPDYLRVLVSLLEFPKVRKEWLVKYNLLSKVAAAAPKDLAGEKSVIESLIDTMKEHGVVAEDEEHRLSFNGDQFDTLYLKYSATSKGITDFFVGVPDEPSINLWRKFETLFLKEFDQYQIHAKFDGREYIKGVGKNARKFVVGARVQVPPGPPGWHNIMQFTIEDLEKKFYLGTENSIRFRVNVDFMKAGFVAQVTFKNPEHTERLRQKFVSLQDKLEYVGLKIMFNDEIFWNNEGVRLIDEGKFDEALKRLDKASEIDPPFELPWLNKARVSLIKKEFDKVVEFATVACELRPNWGKAWEVRAMGLINLGRNKHEKGCISTLKFGTEGSPCAYVGIPYWTHQASNYNGTDPQRKHTDHERQAMYSQIERTLEPTKPDEYDKDHLGYVRAWWD